ncbi:MAG: SpoIID/LytB domain-containing protein [Lachnospiraceae bacterium]|nr:SpoIID/LytB domain-containing protein [Lachnospiraceae bacterium]
MKIFWMTLFTGIFICILLHMLQREQGFRWARDKHKADTDQKEDLEIVQMDTQNQLVRVVLRTTGFTNLYHENVRLGLQGNYQIVIRDEEDEEKAVENTRIEEIKEIKEIEVSNFQLNEGESIAFKPMDQDASITVESIERNVSGKYPTYGGSLEIYKEAEGYLIVNELSIETYLQGVLPSEMPGSYPLEALEAQAICARTYALKTMEYHRMEEYHGDMDDSTSYQVYQNRDGTERTQSAVANTAGKVLMKDHSLMETCYYATSCGVGEEGSITRQNRLKNSGEANYNEEIKPVEETRFSEETKPGEETKFSEEIKPGEETRFSEEIKPGEETKFIEETKPVEETKFSEETKPGEETKCGEEIKRDEEKKSSEEINLSEEKKFQKYIRKLHRGDYESAEPWYRWNGTLNKHKLESLSELGEIQKITVTGRLPSGRIEALRIKGKEGTREITGEYQIRSILAEAVSCVMTQDGKEQPISGLLPSAYFFLVPKGKGGYTILGGGYGHGIGMSQNAAKHMAEEQMDCESILRFFYED